MNSTSDSPVLRLRGHPDLVEELQRALDELSVPVHAAARMRTGGGYAEIVVTLASAGVFTALYELVSRILTRSKDRELTVERDRRGGISISLKGHTLVEERELMRQLAPELLRKDGPRAKAETR